MIAIRKTLYGRFKIFKVPVEVEGPSIEWKFASWLSVQRAGELRSVKRIFNQIFPLELYESACWKSGTVSCLFRYWFQSETETCVAIQSFIIHLHLQHVSSP